MTKRKIIFIFIAPLFAAGTFLFYWLVLPLFVTHEVHENISEIRKPDFGGVISEADDELRVVHTGTFVGADNFHKAAGTAHLLEVDNKYYIRFEDDFTVTNGPDLFVYFGKDGKYSSEARIAGLKGNAGSQNYEVPENINPFDYNEVWIWCRAFSVPFGHARFLEI